MKTIKEKYLLVGADFAGFPLKEAVCEHLRAKGWKITDVGVRADSDPDDTDLMFHRVGLKVGAMISEGEFERALLFCGTGMGIHIAASKCPRVHAGVVESVPAALRAITGNGVNVLAMGAFYVAPKMGCDIADAYLGAELGSGYEWWKNFYEFHKLAIDELDAFDYEEFKKNGYKVEHLGFKRGATVKGVRTHLLQMPRYRYGFKRFTSIESIILNACNIFGNIYTFKGSTIRKSMKRYLC